MSDQISRQKLIEEISKLPVIAGKNSTFVGMGAVLHTIKSQPRADVPDANVGKWIPCSERLPDESMDTDNDGIVTVLVTWEFKDMWFNGCSYCDVVDYDLAFKCFIFSEGKKVTAWKPVEPYKGE